MLVSNIQKVIQLCVCVCVCVCVLVAQSCPSDPMDCSLPGSSVHGFSRQEKWVAIPFSRGPSRPRDQTQVSCIEGGFFTLWATREAPIQFYIYIRLFFYKFFSHLGGVLSKNLVLWSRSLLVIHFKYRCVYINPKLLSYPCRPPSPSSFPFGNRKFVF